MVLQGSFLMVVYTEYKHPMTEEVLLLDDSGQPRDSRDLRSPTDDIQSHGFPRNMTDTWRICRICMT